MERSGVLRIGGLQGEDSEELDALVADAAPPDAAYRDSGKSTARVSARAGENPAPYGSALARPHNA